MAGKQTARRAGSDPRVGRDARRTVAPGEEQRAPSRLVRVHSQRQDRDKELLDQAFEGLERETPDRITNAIRWVRNPKSRWVRLPLGVLCIVASFFWFLPVIGIEFLPIGLLLVAQDVPFLRRPVARLMLWLEQKWRRFRRRFRSKK
jgi:hypothetical protein